MLLCPLLYPPVGDGGTATVIYLMYGGDDVSLEEALSAMKDGMQPAELRDVNITVLDGPTVSLDQLEATCATVPFLAEKRMVIVRGLLDQYEVQRTGRRAGPPERRPLGQWEGLSSLLEAVPATTDLVFVDGSLDSRNALLRSIRSLGEPMTFPVPRPRELPRWVLDRAGRRAIDIEHRAADALADIVGGNLRIIDSELEKLSIYRGGEQVRYQDVEEMVAYVKEANIFAAVDAVLERRPGLAIRHVHQLLDEGRAPPYIITMIARQVRLILLARDVKAQGVPQSEIGGRLSLSGYPLQKTLEQEQRISSERLAAMHTKLLEADVSLKTSAAEDGLVLDMLIAELAA